MPARRLCVLLLIVLFAGCRAPETIDVTGPAQGTTYSVQIAAPPDALDAETVRAAMRAELDAVDAMLSTWRDDSALARVNKAAADQWVAIPAELAALMRRALVIGERTGGAFDITLAPVLRLWGFGPGAGEPRVPDDQALQSAMRMIGSERISVRDQPPALRKSRDGVRIELSGIAQGYTVDRMAERLASMGAQRYLVELGGELFGRGRNARGQPWRVGIEQPKSGVREVRSVVALDGVGISTSGDYRDYFEAGGRRYSHTIDPRDGRPVQHDLRSVTVVGEVVERADALATALLVMGPEAGLTYARERGIAAVFIRGEPGAYTATRTSAFEQFARPR